MLPLSLSLSLSLFSFSFIIFPIHLTWYQSHFLVAFNILDVFQASFAYSTTILEFHSSTCHLTPLKLLSISSTPSPQLNLER